MGRNFFAFSLAFILLASFPIGLAQTVEEDAGITPDSFLFGLDVALDKLSLLLTFDESEKAKKGLEIARERLLEVKEMIELNKIEFAQEAQKSHDEFLAGVEQAINNLDETNSSEEIEQEIEIEQELERHKTKIEEVRGELEIKIKIKGEITPQQQDLIDSILTNLEGSTGRVEIEIENKKGETKIKIKQKTGRSDDDIEEEFDDIEERKGLTKFREEKALDKIEHAQEKITKTERKLIENNLSINVLDLSKSKLDSAKQAYDSGDFQNAILLAKEAKELAEIEKEKIEDTDDDEIEIEVEIKGEISEVEVEYEDVEANFIFQTINRTQIISKISEKTGLSTEEVESIAEFEVDDDTDEITDEISLGTEDEEVQETELRLEYQEHIEHLIKSFANTPEEQGLLKGLEDNLDEALKHAKLSAESETLEMAKAHAQHVINVLEGEEGTSFDSQTLNPGDGYGIIKYISESKKHLNLMRESSDVTQTALTHSDHVEWALDMIEEHYGLAFNSAKAVLNSEEFEEAQQNAEKLLLHITHMIDGFDENGDGQILLIPDQEGGINEAIKHAKFMQN